MSETNNPESKHHLAAIMFADIVGHTALTAADEDKGLRVRTDLVRVAHTEVLRHEGRIVKHIGDAVLAEFLSARHALLAALSIQENFVTQSNAAASNAKLRIGLHLAEVTAIEGGDLHSADINLAARLQTEAAPGMVMVSAHFAAQLQSRVEFAFDCLGDRELKGIRQPVTVYSARRRATSDPASPPVVLRDQSIQIQFLDVDDDRHAELLDKSFNAYVDLFPDENERDSPQDIEAWLREAKVRAQISPWREVYGVVHASGDVVGVVYVTCHITRHWCFANYLGIRKGYRKEGRAQLVYDALEHHIITNIDANSRGLVFEVESVDWSHLEEIRQSGQISSSGDLRNTVLHLRRLRRLLLYQTGNALAFLAANRQPVPYWQPAMSEPLGPQGEVSLILMVLPFVAKEAIDIHDVLEFVFDDLYGDAYGVDGSTTEIAGYRDYVAQVKDRVLSGCRTGWSLGNIATKKQYRELLYWAKREGLYEFLDL
ncbi:MAG TPA: adenylate/guanylate cyclase domain-containing protein [Vicinamibacterales bacterium]|nr:adenylate/guanylate cyclase domain-containing protein [Vicinamibacterales bacterium]